MNIEDAVELLRQQLGARPVETVRVHLWAGKVTPHDSDVLRAVFAAHPGPHPVEVVLHNGAEGSTLMSVPVSVNLQVRAALEDALGSWVNG